MNNKKLLKKNEYAYEEIRQIVDELQYNKKILAEAPDDNTIRAMIEADEKLIKQIEKDFGTSIDNVLNSFKEGVK